MTNDEIEAAKKMAEESLAERAKTTLNGHVQWFAASNGWLGPWRPKTHHWFVRGGVATNIAKSSRHDAEWIAHEHERPLAETVLALIAEVEQLRWYLSDAVDKGINLAAENKRLIAEVERLTKPCEIDDECLDCAARHCFARVGIAGDEHWLECSCHER